MSVSTIVAKMKGNWKSGLAVALVAMPLSISLAVASGSTPGVGIITAVWAGLTAAFFGGSNYNVVGPTGALSGLIAAYVVVNGTEGVASLTVVAGAIILLAYALKLERYLIFIPSSVINGFTLGVALIIAFNQFNSALGLSGLPKHERFFSNVMESFRHIGSASVTTFVIFLLFLALLFVLRKAVPKIPGALLLSPVGIALGYLGSIHALPFSLATLGDTFGHVTFTLVQVPHFELNAALLLPASAVALVAILETMLSARIADGMTHTKHDGRREMLGLGLANIASGLAGGIPATAALARTSLNIKSGASDRLSSFMSAIFLALISYFLLAYFRFIPMAVIAAILVYVAILMTEREHFVRFYKYQRSGFWVSLIVAGVTFYEDPIVGIVFGTALALLMFVEKLSHGHFDLKLNTFGEGIVQTMSGDHLDETCVSADVLLYSFKGKLAYINSRAHITRFETELAKYKIVILRLRSVYFIDLDGAEALDEIIAMVRDRGQQVCLTSPSASAASLLEMVSTNYRALKQQGLVFEKSEEALHHFGVKTGDLHSLHHA